MWNLLKTIFVSLLSNTDAMLTFLDTQLASWKKAAEATETKLDDLAVKVLEVLLSDQDIREQFKLWIAWLVGLLVTNDVESIRAEVRNDAATVRLAQQVAGKLNIDWQKIIDMLLKILPIILPLVLDPNEDTKTETSDAT